MTRARLDTRFNLLGSTSSAFVSQDDWDSHWDDFSEANERNPAQKFRLRLVMRLLEAKGPPRRLLDIGSGNGELLAAAARRWPGPELLGLELSRSAIGQAARKVPTARFRQCNLLQPSGADIANWATHAVCSEVLEHVDDPVAVLTNARAWLATGCFVVITVPGGPMSAFDRHIGHRRHYSPADLRELMRAAGFEPLGVWGAGFPIFNLFRCLVIARGARLIDDARASSSEWSGGRIVRMATAVFEPLFHLAGTRGRLGWQTVGMCRKPLDQAASHATPRDARRGIRA